MDWMYRRSVVMGFAWGLLVSVAGVLMPVAEATDDQAALAEPPVSPHMEQRSDLARSPRRHIVTQAARVTQGPYTAVQVNVDAHGQNIVGDAANEPSIAIDPTNPNRIVIGWRQFDTITSNFRQAGRGYSTDAGRTWTFSGVHEPGVFRSDPVLAADNNGVIYYYSLTEDFACQMFRSLDGGKTWLPKVPGLGGDKQWFTIDRTHGPGEGSLYALWSTCCGAYTFATFTRSLDGGNSFLGPYALPVSPWAGTLTVAPNGTVHMLGAEFPGSTSTVLWLVSSPDAWDGFVSPSFTARAMSLRGNLVFNAPPNPGGLLGQAWIVSDHSGGPTHGNLYALASVKPMDTGDPLDVHFARSTNGGQTWSPAIRINDDPVTQANYQWFGTLSIAPNGRLDAVWLDTRNGSGPGESQLYYSTSSDAGATWSPNLALTPKFNSLVGFPMQNKMGDYFHMLSDDVGASLAFAATFTGGQDVYYMRIGDYDCNGNGVSDLLDIGSGAYADLNANGIPDVCEPDCNANGKPDDFDIAQGTSTDCDGNGTPDECQPGYGQDCNSNQVDDFCDIALGTSGDCNGNLVPDECDVVAGAPDCNGNLVPDSCEPGGTTDCNNNGIPDLCDIFNGTSQDCSGNGVPTECEPDCNNNGQPDDCEVVSGQAPDCNGNLRPDSCDFVPGPVLFPLNSDPGWTRTGQWAFGVPQGLGGGGSFSPDPTSGYTGANVFGVNLNGNYVVSANNTFYLTAGPFDFRNASAVQLTYRRWLNAQGQSRTIHNVQVSTNGTNWTNVWTNSTSLINDSAWTLQTHNITTQAAGRPTVYVRWGYRIQSSVGGLASGWNLDDIGFVVTAPSGDCNGNQIPDECDIAAGTVPDCDGNGVPDACDLFLGGRDCNANGKLDVCDITDGSSGDCNGNGRPDECDTAGGVEDCNGNHVPDSCDLQSGTSPDCNSNGYPDECDLAQGFEQDCNGNGIPDVCDVAQSDCNGNGIPDDCDALTLGDCDNNDLPDACDIAAGAPDCNSNGLPDTCDLAAGAPDCNGSGVPDTCDLAPLPFSTQSADLSPLGGVTHTFTINTPPEAVTDVTLTVFARGDIVFVNEIVTVAVDGTPVGVVLDGTHFLCVPEQTDTLTIPAALFNAAAADGSVVVTLTPSPLIDPTACSETYIRVRVTYGAPQVSADGNGDGVPDECQVCHGDANCDQAVTFADVNLFVAALSGETAWATAYANSHNGNSPTCAFANNDVNGDGTVTFADIDPFVARLGSTCSN